MTTGDPRQLVESIFSLSLEQDTDQYERYLYTPLSKATNEIRLVTLLPTSCGDAIHITISHYRLIAPTAAHAPKRLLLQEIRKTLPPNWSAYETNEGPIIFWYSHNGNRKVSWTHPNPCIPHDSYSIPSSEAKAAAEPRYEALSYTWGPAGGQETALVVETDDTSAEHKPHCLPIGQSLASAIRHLRLPDRPRVFWIDAICINQDDHRERSEQVRRMGEIFSNADRVIAWLGRSSGTSRLAMSTMAHLGSRIVVSKDSFVLPHPDCADSEMAWHDMNRKLPYDEATWSAIQDLWQRQWFERMWVVQEIQLANSKSIIQCGHDIVPWPRFRDAVIHLSSGRTGTPKSFNAAAYNVWSLCDGVRDATLEILLLRTATRKCSDDRDRIYGILSIAPPWLGRELVPDCALSLMDVYKTVFLLHTRNTTRISLLPFLQSSATPNWPTWVPDFRSKSRLFEGLQLHAFCASSVSGAVERFD